MKRTHTHTGWWYTYPSEKYEFVSWENVPNHHTLSHLNLSVASGSNATRLVPNHQPAHMVFKQNPFEYRTRETNEGFIKWGMAVSKLGHGHPCLG